MLFFSLLGETLHRLGVCTPTHECVERRRVSIDIEQRSDSITRMDGSLGGNIGSMESEQSPNEFRFLFDIVSAAILGVTALAGACAPLYLAGYKLVFGSGDTIDGDSKGAVLSYNDSGGGGGGGSHHQKRSLAFVVGNMFSAGVMVSAGLCHLLGEAIRDMNRMQSIPPQDQQMDRANVVQSYTHQFPWATFLCGCGLLVTLCADKLASIVSHQQYGTSCCPSSPVLMEASRSEYDTSYSYQGSIELSGIPLSMSEDLRDEELHNRGLSRPVTRGNHHAHIDTFQHSTKSSGRVSFITAMLMGVALCFHSLLEGAALGAQETITNSMHIFIAIVSHKGLAAYALGSSLVESRVDMEKFWKVIIPFALASPVGILLGYFLSGIAQGLGAAALSALASGTFLYVAFMEVIPRELVTEDYNVFVKLACLLLGFFMMSTLAIWA